MYAKSRQTTMRDLFQKTRQEWLEEARSTARLLLKKSPGKSITVEDVLLISPRPGYLHPNCTGSVFKDRDFRAVGFTLARKPSSHKRIIRRWSLTE